MSIKKLLELLLNDGFKSNDSKKIILCDYE